MRRRRVPRLSRTSRWRFRRSVTKPAAAAAVWRLWSFSFAWSKKGSTGAFSDPAPSPRTPGHLVGGVHGNRWSNQSSRVAPMIVWVDCTAAATTLALRPIIERLEARGDEVFITAREYGQTVGILDRLGMHYTVVGEHGGASGFGKARALESRSRALTKVVWEHQPELALAHGSVDLAVVCWLLRISSVQMQDYEFAN